MTFVGPDSASLWRNRDFNTFWTGQALSVLGDAFATIATPLLVLQATGSVGRMGMLTAVIAAANVCAGVFSGLVVDRVDRRALMIACDTARALIWTLVPALWWTRGASMPLLFVATALSACLGNVFQVAAVSALPDLLEGRAQITEANGRMQGTYAAMYLLGPMAAGYLCQRVGPIAALAVNGGSFVASVLSLTRVQLRRRPGGRESIAPVANALGEMLAGARFLLAQPVLRAVTVILALSNGLLAARNDLFVYYLKHDLHRGADDVGAMFGVAALGAVCSGVVAAPLKRRWGFGPCWLGAGIVLGLFVATVGWARSVWLVTPLTIVVAFSDALQGINSMSLRQEITPPRLLGRVTSAFWLLINLVSPLGAIAMTRVASRAGVSFALSFVGLANMALFALACFTPARRGAQTSS